jgi:hypothetical protein
MWNRTDDGGWYRDLSCGDMWIGTDDKDAVLTKYKVNGELEIMWN